MKHGKKIAVRGLSSVVALSICGLGGAAISAFADAPEAPESEGVEAVVAQAAARVTSPQVVGTFSATQTELTPLDQVVRTFGNGSYNLCSDVLRTESAVAAPVADVMDWTISITGDVANPYAITMQEVADKGNASSIMGCTCAGNPAAGVATINAEVTGPSIAALVDEAAPAADANALTFVAADGSEVSVPLWYVYTRPALVAYQIDGEPLVDTLGAANQVWIGSTSANHFVRDIVEIRVEALDEEPAMPGDGIEYANVPNASVFSAVEA